MAVFSPYEDLSPVARDNTPIHIPSGIPGEPQTTGTATIGNRVMPFPIQQDTAAEQQVWVKRMNEFDRVKRETEKAEQDAAYLKNLMMNQRTTASARAVEAASTFQAMRNYERDYNTAIASGLSPSQASIQAIARNPRMLKGTSGAAFLNAITDYTPKPIDIPGVDRKWVQTGRTGRFAPADPEARVTLQPADPMQGRLKPSYSVSGTASSVAPYAPSMGITNLPTARRPSAPAVQASPLPTDKKALQANKVYVTKRGLARWTGEHFESVE